MAKKGKFRLIRGFFYTPEGLRDLAEIHRKEKTPAQVAAQRGALPDTVYKAYRRAVEKGLLNSVELVGNGEARRNMLTDLGADALGELMKMRHEGFKAEIAQLKERLAEKDEIEAGLRNQLADRDAQIATMDRRMQERALVAAGGNVKAD